MPTASAQTQAAPLSRGDLGAYSGYLLSAPLRLSLEGSILSVGHSFPNCATREDDAGNSVGGIPIQHYAEWRFTPRLTLSGFTQLGCPIDAGIGGTLMYVAPLRPSMQIVFGVGMYMAPGQQSLFGGSQASPAQLVASLASSALRGLHGDSPVQAGARVDLVVDTKDVGPLHLGVESQGPARHGIKLGGGF